MNLIYLCEQKILSKLTGVTKTNPEGNRYATLAFCRRLRHLSVITMDENG